MTHQKGISLIEILVAIVVIGIIGTLSLPQLLPARAAAEEGAAAAGVRSLVTAEATYAATHPTGQFGSMDDLKEAGLLNGGLADGQIHGYSFEVVPHGGAGFTIVAYPTDVQSRPRKSYYSDETGVIRFSDGDTLANSSSPPLGGKGKGWALIPVLD